MASPVAGNITSTVSASNDSQADRSDSDNEVPASQLITSSRSRQTSWDVPRRRERAKIPEQPIAPGQDDARWREVFDRFEHLSKDTWNIQSALQELHKERHEKLTSKSDLLRAQNELEQARLSLETVTKKWKKTASELNNLRSQESRLYQLLDADLDGLVQGLRYEIRNFSFSFQYSAINSPEQFLQPQSDGLENYMVEAMEELHGNHGHRISETMGPALVQSFLWRVLVSEIFEQFRWAPQLQSSITDVYNILHPGGHHSDRFLPQYPLTRVFLDRDCHSRQGISTGREAERKFQIWKATTSALILESMECEGEEKCRRRMVKFTSDISALIIDVVKPFALGSDKISDQLELIINMFIGLDEKICRQATRVDWLFPSLQHSAQFNPETMAARGREIPPEPGQHVDMIVAPGLKKRGRHMGEDFESEYLLLKMDVICTPSSKGRGGKGQCGQVDTEVT
ncbi:hypothetical protein TruAng_002459 [Truncatella angustata]|nr:hypothetical protein TruAng_002459 [Truncatella angustata]